MADLLDDIIEVLSKCIGKKWKELAHQLKFSPTDIDAIEYDNRGQLKEQIFQLFHKWKQQQGQDASAQVLIEGLRAAGLQEELDSLGKATGLTNFGTSADKSSKLRSPLDSPAEREHVRKKRLERFSPGSKKSDASPETGIVSPTSSCKDSVKQKRQLADDRPFEQGDMVKVVRTSWYGVIRWIGKIDGLGDGIIAGVEMDEKVPGSSYGYGEIRGKQYFTCPGGYGLLQRVEMLERFNPDEFRLPESDGEDGDDHVEKDMDQRVAATARSHSLEATPEKEAHVHRSRSSPNPLTVLLQELGLSQKLDELRDTRSSATTQAVNDEAHSDDSDERKILAFHFPGDRAGLIIGRDGQNVRDVETETNTKILIDKPGRGDLGQNGHAAIVGKEVDCKRALRMILENLNRKIARHLAAKEAMTIPNSRLCGRVIGKDGSTLHAIESLSGARLKIDNKEGIARMLDGPVTCNIIGSAEQIEEAKDLIEKAMEGENVVLRATLIAVLPVLMKEFTEKHGFQFDSNDLD